MNIMELLHSNFSFFSVLAASVFVILVSGYSRKTRFKSVIDDFLLIVSLSSLVASVYFSWKLWILGGDLFPLISIILISVSTFLSLLVSRNYIAKSGLNWPEFIALSLFATLGGFVMAQSKDLITTFVGLEILSISAYPMAAYLKSNRLSLEAGIKYFILGAVASGILLFGIAFYYGSTGTFSFEAIGDNKVLYLVAISLIIAGFGFKIALVPFQFWAPDVYEGAPLPSTAFFITTVKVAAIVAFFRLMSLIGGTALNLTDLFIVISVITMTFGNLAALKQDNLKRMLAYSSIAHAGYMMIAFVFLKSDFAAAKSTLLFYLLSYVLMSIGAFAVLILNSSNSSGIDSFAGLGKRNPWIAAAFSIFMFSFAGFPPLGGFFAKFYLFKAAVSNGFVLLTAAALLNSVVSAYYYLRPVVAAYFGVEKGIVEQCRETSNYSLIGVIVFSLISIVLLGVLPQTVLTIFQR